MNDTTLKIYSSKFLFDSWLVELRLSDERLVIYHLNKKMKKINNRYNKCVYHKHGVVKCHNWLWVLQRISSHNRFVVEVKGQNNLNFVDRILSKYNEEKGEL